MENWKFSKILWRLRVAFMRCQAWCSSQHFFPWPPRIPWRSLGSWARSFHHQGWSNAFHGHLPGDVAGCEFVVLLLWLGAPVASHSRRVNLLQAIQPLKDVLLRKAKSILGECMSARVKTVENLFLGTCPLKSTASFYEMQGSLTAFWTRRNPNVAISATGHGHQGRNLQSMGKTLKLSDAFGRFGVLMSQSLSRKFIPVAGFSDCGIRSRFHYSLQSRLHSNHYLL